MGEWTVSINGEWTALSDTSLIVSLDAWFTMSIDAAWRVSIDASFVDLWIVRESAGSFKEGPRNLVFIVIPGTKMYVPEIEEKILSVFFFWNNSKT